MKYGVENIYDVKSNMTWRRNIVQKLKVRSKGERKKKQRMKKRMNERIKKKEKEKIEKNE